MHQTHKNDSIGESTHTCISPPYEDEGLVSLTASQNYEFGDRYCHYFGQPMVCCFGYVFSEIWS